MLSVRGSSSICPLELGVYVAKPAVAEREIPGQHPNPTLISHFACDVHALLPDSDSRLIFSQPRSDRTETYDQGKVD